MLCNVSSLFLLFLVPRERPKLARRSEVSFHRRKKFFFAWLFVKIVAVTGRVIVKEKKEKTRSKETPSLVPIESDIENTQKTDNQTIKMKKELRKIVSMKCRSKSCCAMNFFSSYGQGVESYGYSRSNIENSR